MDINLCSPAGYLADQTDIDSCLPTELLVEHMGINLCPHFKLVVDQTDINLCLPTNC